MSAVLVETRVTQEPVRRRRRPLRRVMRAVLPWLAASAVSYGYALVMSVR